MKAPFAPQEASEESSEFEIDVDLEEMLASFNKSEDHSQAVDDLAVDELADVVVEVEADISEDLEDSSEADPIADVLAMFDEHSAAEAETQQAPQSRTRSKGLPLPPKITAPEPPSRKKADIEELPLSALEPLSAQGKPKTTPQPRAQRPRTERTPRAQSQNARPKVPSQGPRVRPQGPSEFAMNHADAFRLPLNANSFPVRRPPAPKTGVRWGRILMIIAPFAMIFFVMRWYVGSTATAQFPTSAQLDLRSPALGSTASAIPIEDDPLIDLDTELRSKIRPACLSITPDTLVEDVMTVELDAFDIDVVSVRASIVEWTGRKLDRPRTGTFRFRVKGDDSYEYQLAAIALVIGKYMDVYVMDVAKLEVTIDTRSKSLQFDLDPDLVARYYRENVELRQLFSISN